MSEPSIFFFEVNERQGVFHRRAFLLGGLTGMGLLALGDRLAQNTEAASDDYRACHDLSSIACCRVASCASGCWQGGFGPACKASSHR